MLTELRMRPGINGHYHHSLVAFRRFLGGGGQGVSGSFAGQMCFPVFFPKQAPNKGRVILQHRVDLPNRESFDSAFPLDHIAAVGLSSHDAFGSDHEHFVRGLAPESAGGNADCAGLVVDLRDSVPAIITE